MQADCAGEEEEESDEEGDGAHRSLNPIPLKSRTNPFEQLLKGQKPKGQKPSGWRSNPLVQLIEGQKPNELFEALSTMEGPWKTPFSTEDIEAISKFTKVNREVSVPGLEDEVWALVKKNKNVKARAKTTHKSMLAMRTMFEAHQTVISTEDDDEYDQAVNTLTTLIHMEMSRLYINLKNIGREVVGAPKDKPAKGVVIVDVLSKEYLKKKRKRDMDILLFANSKRYKGEQKGSNTQESSTDESDKEESSDGE